MPYLTSLVVDPEITGEVTITRSGMCCTHPAKLEADRSRLHLRPVTPGAARVRGSPGGFWTWKWIRDTFKCHVQLELVRTEDCHESLNVLFDAISPNSCDSSNQSCVLWKALGLYGDAGAFTFFKCSLGMLSLYLSGTARVELLSTTVTTVHAMLEDEVTVICDGGSLIGNCNMASYNTTSAELNVQLSATVISRDASKIRIDPMEDTDDDGASPVVYKIVGKRLSRV